MAVHSPVIEGSQIEAGCTAPLYLRLFDDNSQKSEKIRLRHTDRDTHHFQPGLIDEFHITSDKPLTTIKAIEISHTANKYQGWSVGIPLCIEFIVARFSKVRRMDLRPRRRSESALLFPSSTLVGQGRTGRQNRCLSEIHTHSRALRTAA